VQKELEDLPQPEHAIARSATFHGDQASSSRRAEEVSRTHFSRQWIPMGRDTALEQQMLNTLGTCFGGQSEVSYDR